MSAIVLDVDGRKAAVLMPDQTGFVLHAAIPELSAIDHQHFGNVRAARVAARQCLGRRRARAPLGREDA